MDAGNRYRHWPLFVDLQEGQDLERFKHLVLVHAARFAHDLSYLPLMQQLEQRYNGKLRIQTVVSREESPGSLTGRVPALIEMVLWKRQLA